MRQSHQRLRRAAYLRAVLAGAVLLYAASGTALANADPPPLAPEEVRKLVSGRSIGISFYGDPTNPATTNVWDFRSNGTLCGRAAGTKVGDKCADEGKWEMRGERLCWELTWLGGSFGFKAACTTWHRLPNGHLELRNDKEPALRYAVSRVL